MRDEAPLVAMAIAATPEPTIRPRKPTARYGASSNLPSRSEACVTATPASIAMKAARAARSRRDVVRRRRHSNSNASAGISSESAHAPRTSDWAHAGAASWEPVDIVDIAINRDDPGREDPAPRW